MPTALKNMQATLDTLKKYEQYRARPYKPVKTEKYLTIGFGHYGSDVKPGMNWSLKKANEVLEDDVNIRLVEIQRELKGFSKYSEELQINVVQGWFRGDLSKSKATKDLLNAGDFAGAAVEFLDHKEYRNAVANKKSGIQPRMEAISDAMLAEGGVPKDIHTYMGEVGLSTGAKLKEFNSRQAQVSAAYAPQGAAPGQTPGLGLPARPITSTPPGQAQGVAPGQVDPADVRTAKGRQLTPSEFATLNAGSNEPDEPLPTTAEQGAAPTAEQDATPTAEQGAALRLLPRLPPRLLPPLPLRLPPRLRTRRSHQVHLAHSRLACKTHSPLAR